MQNCLFLPPRHRPTTQQRVGEVLCQRGSWTSPEESSCPLQRVIGLASSPKMALNICLHPNGSTSKAKATQGRHRMLTPVQDPEMMTQISACVGKVVFPLPPSADCALREKPSTHVCLVTHDMHGCCHGNLQPISLDLSMESPRRTGRGPRG